MQTQAQNTAGKQNQDVMKDQKTEQKAKTAYKKVENAVVGSYQAVEDGVVGGYQKMQDSIVHGFTRISDRFVARYLQHEGETLDEAKARIKRQEEELNNPKTQL